MIDKPSLAALLASIAKKSDEPTSTRPFVLKDPKAVVKEMMARRPKPEAKEEDDDSYLASLLKEETEEVDEFAFADLSEPEEKLTAQERLKKILGNK